jgi:hypothetical protein
MHQTIPALNTPSKKKLKKLRTKYSLVGQNNTKLRKNPTQVEVHKTQFIKVFKKLKIFGITFKILFLNFFTLNCFIFSLSVLNILP